MRKVSVLLYLNRNGRWLKAGEFRFRSGLQSAEIAQFYYGLAYAKQYANGAEGASISAKIPVRLMEVFEGDLISDWLAQYLHPNNAQLIRKWSPNNMLGNLLVDLTQNLSGSGDDPTLLMVPEKRELISVNPLNTVLSDHPNRLLQAYPDYIGYISGRPHLFFSTDGHKIYPTRCIENQPELLARTIPLDSDATSYLTSDQSSRMQLRQTRMKVLRTLGAMVQDYLPCGSDSQNYDLVQTSLLAASLPRFDILTQTHPVTYLATETLGFVFKHALDNCTDLLDLIKQIVSTYICQQMSSKSLNNFVTQLLIRDLVFRLFEVPLSWRKVHLIQGDGEVHLAPIGVELLHSAPLISRSEIPWSYPLCVNRDPDYPLICTALEDFIDPSKLLLTLCEISESLLQLESIVLCEHGTGAVADPMLKTVRLFGQKLNRWGLIS